MVTASGIVPAVHSYIIVPTIPWGPNFSYDEVYWRLGAMYALYMLGLANFFVSPPPL